MFKFIANNEPKPNITKEYIEEVENKLNIKFPEILKEYYLNYNCAELKECKFTIKGISEEFVLDYIIPLNYGTTPFEKVYEWTLSNEAIPKGYIAFAYDICSDEFYWDPTSNKVYYIRHDDVENPVLICETIEEFFEILNKCCEETVNLENVNYQTEEVNNNNEPVNNDEINKVLKYNNGLMIKLYLISLACIIISLVLIPITGGLSIAVAFAIAPWLIIFVCIDIMNRIISYNEVKKYNIDELKNELLDAKTTKIAGTETYLTENYIISNSKTIKITRYDDIVWTYAGAATGNVKQRNYISIAYSIGGTPILARLKSGKEKVITLLKSTEQLNKLFKKITSKNNDVLIGNSPENIKKYENINKKFKIKNKIGDIAMIILFIIVIIGIIYSIITKNI